MGKILIANLPGGVCHGILTLRHISHRGSFESVFSFGWREVSSPLEVLGGSITGFFGSSAGREGTLETGWEKLAWEVEGLFKPSLFASFIPLEEPVAPYLLCIYRARVLAFWISSADIGRLWLTGTGLVVCELLPAIFCPGCSTNWTFLRSRLSGQAKELCCLIW